MLTAGQIAQVAAVGSTAPTITTSFGELTATANGTPFRVTASSDFGGLTATLRVVTSIFPLVRIEFSPTTNPLDTPTWVDITDKVVGQISWTFGRVAELDEFSVGTLSFMLEDEDRDFDSSNTSGAYYPNIKPRKKVRVRSGGVDLFTGWITNWTTSYDLAFRKIYSSCTAVDALGMLGTGKLTGSPYWHTIRRDGPAAYYSMRDLKTGIIVDDSFTGTYPATMIGDLSPKSEQEQDALSPSFLGFNGTEGQRGYLKTGNVLGDTPPSTQSIEFWVRTDRTAQSLGGGFFAGPYTFQNSQAINEIDSSSPDAFGRVIFYNTGQLAVSNALGLNGNVNHNDGVWHQCVITCDGSNVKFYFDGELDVSISSSQKIFAATTGTGLGGYAIGGWLAACTVDLKEVSFWTTTLTADQVANHYHAAKGWPGDKSGERIERVLDIAGWPDAFRDIDLGQSFVSDCLAFEASPLEIIKQYAIAEHGAFWASKNGYVVFKSRYAFNEDSNSRNTQYTYGHTGSDLRYEALTPKPDDVLLFNTVLTSIEGSDAVNVARDATSVAAYYEIAGYEKTGLALANNNDAIAIGQLILERHKDFTPRIDLLRINARASDTHRTAVIDHELWDRIVVKHKPNNVGSDVTYTCYIESITHELDFRALTWYVGLTLSPVYSNTYFIIGTDSIGGSAVIGI